jgi:hypothetical protein
MHAISRFHCLFDFLSVFCTCVIVLGSTLKQVIQFFVTLFQFIPMSISWHRNRSLIFICYI